MPLTRFCRAKRILSCISAQIQPNPARIDLQPLGRSINKTLGPTIDG
jgi:hypothetical protein